MVQKDISIAKANLDASTSFIPERYAQGVQGADWKTNAGSDQAEKNYAAGVNQAVAEKSRMKGISKVSNEEWKNHSMNEGKQRIASGIKANLDKYEKNFGPVLNAVNAVAKSLPPRTTDAMQNIDARLKKIVQTAINASKK